MCGGGTVLDSPFDLDPVDEAVFRKWFGNANFDPIVTPMLLATAVVGGGLTAAGTIAGGNSAAAMGRAQAGEASFESAQARANAGAVLASSQRRMFETQQNTGLLVSKARAIGAAGGVNVGTGSAAENQAQTAQRGWHAAAMDLWNGQNAASDALMQARGKDYSGLIDIMGGKEAQDASRLTAAGQFATTIAGAGATVYKNNMPPPVAPSYG